MKLHVKSRNRGRASNDGFFNLLDPVMQVVVLPSPAVERIGVAVHVDELLLGDGSHTAKVVVVLESVVPLVDGHAQVLGVVLRTAVEIPVIKQKILIVRTIRMYKKSLFIVRLVSVWLDWILPTKKFCPHTYAVKILNPNQSNWRPAVPTVTCPNKVSVLCSAFKKINHSRPLFRYFCLFNINFCCWLDSNCGSLELEATALPTEP